MSDDLVKMCRRLSKYAHAQLSASDLERIADRIEELEAKLAKAVAALYAISGDVPYADDPYDIARITLAELKEQK